MRRRQFITSAASLASGWLLSARAQQAGRVYRIGFLANDPTIPVTAAGAAFMEGLREQGFVEGRNLIVERRFAEGQMDRAALLAEDLIRLNIDLLVASGVQNQVAAKRATTKIPIVMVNATDPVGLGLVASLARPGGNVTGLVQVPSADLAGKRLQLFKNAAPRASRIAVLMNPDYPSDQSGWEALNRAAQPLGLTLRPVRVRQGSELPAVLARLSSELPDALFAMNNGLNLTYRKAIIGFTTVHHLPSMHSFAEATRDGALMSYSANRPALFRHAATYVGKILKGASPAEMPIEQPTQYALVINLKTAKALGLTIPPSLLLRADEVIE